RRVVGVYREDGSLFPDETGRTQRILGQDTVDACLALGKPFYREWWQAARMAAANLSLLNFVQHGEQRDGIFAHGPYSGPDGTVVWFEEFNDLRNTRLPWVEKRPLIPYDNVVLIYAAKDVHPEFNMFGAMSVDLHEPEGVVRLVGALHRSGDVLFPMDADDLAEVSKAAAASQLRIFERALAWEPRYRIGYGAFLFANHLAPVFDIAKIPGGGDQVTRTFSETAPAIVDRLVADPEIPSFWRHLAVVDEDEMYNPIISLED